MTARFVLDESSWAGAAKAAVLADAIECLLRRLDVARERGEGVLKHADFHETDLGDGVQLYSLLFEPDCRVRLDRDVTLRLSLALDQINEFDESGLVEHDADFEGRVRFAPGVAWAHASCSERRHIAVLPVPLRDVPLGRIPVTVSGATREIFFVAEESEHVGFFRSVITLENADEKEFGILARSAFPALEWADNIWRGLRHFSRPYIDVREQVINCLGGLSDHGARCFHEHGAGDPRHLAHILSARVGKRTSDENGATKRHTPSKQDRTRRHRGIDKVFWWHVKLRPNVDRIHFRYEPQSAGSPGLGEGQIVVGLFKDHCVLPN